MKLLSRIFLLLLAVNNYLFAAAWPFRQLRSWAPQVLTEISDDRPTPDVLPRSEPTPSDPSTVTVADLVQDPPGLNMSALQNPPTPHNLTELTDPILGDLPVLMLAYQSVLLGLGNGSNSSGVNPNNPPSPADEQKTDEAERKKAISDGGVVGGVIGAVLTDAVCNMFALGSAVTPWITQAIKEDFEDKPQDSSNTNGTTTEPQSQESTGDDETFGTSLISPITTSVVSTAISNVRGFKDWFHRFKQRQPKIPTDLDNGLPELLRQHLQDAGVPGLQAQVVADSMSQVVKTLSEKGLQPSVAPLQKAIAKEAQKIAEGYRQECFRPLNAINRMTTHIWMAVAAPAAVPVPVPPTPVDPAPVPPAPAPPTPPYSAGANMFDPLESLASHLSILQDTNACVYRHKD
ncbi:hypothetical protein EJ04DRAFT_564283 [Polyplosphaeria fusca]|uniref:Uncharacterized protein n=1 Tax=Polyplosphaeria fusca TaxID=682080 RepID=A0A9P4R084_9PLEO|nr:hypothetical protein EJ04DRAFT_564283 [Polyplosphaeria fusca]